MTDEARMYSKLGKEFSAHGTTLHGIREYVRGDIHTNTVKGYFSIFKARYARRGSAVQQHRGTLVTADAIFPALLSSRAIRD